MLVTLGVYVIGMLIGYYIPVEHIEMGNRYDFTTEAAPWREENSWVIFKHIAVSNCKVALMSIVFGALTLGLLAIVHAFYNAFIWGHAIGYYSNYLSQQQILWSTIPHSGEIFGMALAACTGFFISLKFFLPRYAPPLRQILLCGVVSFLLIIVSAFIESYVSMRP